jgi:hypothetical protein
MTISTWEEYKNILHDLLSVSVTASSGMGWKTPHFISVTLSEQKATVQTFVTSWLQISHKPQNKKELMK